MVNFYNKYLGCVFLLNIFLFSVLINAQNYTGNFGAAVSTFPTTYTDSVSFIIEEKPWFASVRYHNGNDFRLGKSSSATVPAKFIPTEVQGASVEMEWDIAYPKTISLATSTSYGEPRVWRIYESTDQGNSWTLMKSKDYTVNSEWSTVNITPKLLARYAFVITGVSNPRVRLNDIKIETEIPISEAPVLEFSTLPIYANLQEQLNHILRFKNYPTSVTVEGLEGLGLYYNSETNEIEGIPNAMGEFPLQIQASNAYGSSQAYTVLLKVGKGNQTLNNLSNLTLAFNLLQYNLPLVTDQGQLVNYSSSNLSIATITNNVLNFNGVGSFNLIATAEENESYKAFTKTISVRINKGTQNLSSDYSDMMNLIGETIDLNVTETQQQQPLRFTTVNPEVATVINNQLKFLSLGKTTLRIEADETSTYQAFSKVVNLEALPLNTCYFENFSSNILPMNWTRENASFENGYLNFASRNGNVIFPAPTNAKTFIFDLERTNTASQRTLNILISNDGISFQTIASYTPDNTTLQQNVSVDLSAYENVNWIKLEKVSATTAYWRVDNLKIECTIPRETTVWENGQWSNGLPTLDKIVVVNEALEWNNNSLEAYELIINSSGQLIVKSGSGLNVRSKITNEGQANQFIIEEGAYVLQDEEVTNTGEVIIYNKSRPMFRNDMSIWSSPVTNQGIRAFSPETLYNRIWDYDESATNYRPLFNTDSEPDLLFESAKGVAIRVRNTLPTNTIEEQSGVFKGIMHNGNYTVFATKDGSGYNLVGNPYPSAIALDGSNGFFAQNPSVAQIFIWTPFYRTTDENFGNNYITITKTGAVGPYADNPRIIAPGQGFFVQVSEPTQINFNNAMRVGERSLFYRSSTSTKDQFYLSLIKDEKKVNRQLIRYTDQATKGFDEQWDAISVETGGNKNYSILNDRELSIQARGSFDQEDRVKIGYQTSSAGDIELHVEQTEGIFEEEQRIYLYDKVQDVFHLISSSPYRFYSDAGIYNDRFEILYEPLILSLIEVVDDEIRFYTQDSKIVVQSSIKINKWQITSIDGRMMAKDEVYNKKDINVELPKGIYTITLWLNQKRINRKFIIH